MDTCASGDVGYEVWDLGGMGLEVTGSGVWGGKESENMEMVGCTMCEIWTRVGDVCGDCGDPAEICAIRQICEICHTACYVHSRTPPPPIRPSPSTHLDQPDDPSVRRLDPSSSCLDPSPPPIRPPTHLDQPDDPWVRREPSERLDLAERVDLLEGVKVALHTCGRRRALGDMGRGLVCGLVCKAIGCEVSWTALSLADYI